MANNKFRSGCAKLKELYKNHFLLVFTLCLIKLAPALLLSLVNPYVSAQLENIESNSLLVGLALSMNTISVFMTCMFFGYYSEWSFFGRNATITFGILTTAGSSMLIGIAESYAVFFIILSVSGVGAAATMCCAYSIILDAIPGHLLVLALAHMEFFEAVGWTVGPLLFGTILTSKKKVFYPFLAVGLVQLTIAIYSCVVMFFQLKPVRKKAREDDKIIKKTIFEKLKLIFTRKEAYIVLVSNFVTCFSFRFVGSIMALHYDDNFRSKLFFSVPGGPIAVLMVPFMRSWIRAKNYVTYCLPFLALIYMLIGDYPIDKTSLGYETYNVVTYILLIFRDWIFWMSYVLCNVVIMEGIVLKNQGIELNGFCAALYLFSFNFGDAAGLLLGNVVFKMYGYNIVTFSTMILLCVGFVTILIIRFWKKIKNFFS